MLFFLTSSYICPFLLIFYIIVLIIQEYIFPYQCFHSTVFPPSHFLAEPQAQSAELVTLTKSPLVFHFFAFPYDAHPTLSPTLRFLTSKDTSWFWLQIPHSCTHLEALGQVTNGGAGLRLAGLLSFN